MSSRSSDNRGSEAEASATATDRLKDDARRAVESLLPALVELSHAIHDHPETAFDEERAAGWSAEVLAGSGFAVTPGVAGLPTAFSAESGTGPLVVAVCAEYDALPGIGHACGHNLIAASAVGAAIGLAGVADRLGLTVRLLGTPGEEGGGGKVLMLEQGAFDDVHAAMMVHPWPADRLVATCLAVSHFDVIFTGRSAHASAAPWEGINAADAMVVSQVAIGLLRQQLRPGDQVHGVVLDSGGAANVIPERVTGRFMCRSITLARLEELEPKVRACFEAGALATGSRVAYESLSPVYSHMESDGDLLGLYRSNAERLGRRFDLDDEGVPPPTLSTDMANVSLAVPTIHPLMGIEAGGAVNHQPEFAAACVSESADKALHDAAIAMAWTAIDAAAPGPVRERLLAGSR